MSKIICLGVIGGGQLGSLLCSATKKLKIKTVVLSDDKDGPAQHFCDEFIYSKYNDNEKVKEFITKVDVVTYEFENIPIDFLNLINREKKVLPSPKINKIAQYPFRVGLSKPMVMGVSARTSFKRSEYGMKYALDKELVGDEIELIIEFEARQE